MGQDSGTECQMAEGGVLMSFRPKTDFSSPCARRWIKTYPLVIVAHLGRELFVLMQAMALFISLHPQYCLQPSILEELMNGGIQTLAGLYGVTMTGYVFFLGRIDTLVQADWTISDVIETLKKQFVRMVYLISAAFLLSLFLCGLNVYLQSYVIQMPSWVNLLLLNESLLFIGITVLVIVYYIVNLVDPGNLRRAADTLRKTLEQKKHEPGDPALFFMQYQKLEAQCQTLLPEQMQNIPLGNIQLEYLRWKGILTLEMLQTAKEIRQYHSCVIHGSEISVSQAACNQVTELAKQLCNPPESKPSRCGSAKLERKQTKKKAKVNGD